MFVFDTHCDTVTTARGVGLGLCNSRTQLSLDRSMGESWCQCFAIWLEDGLRGQAAWDFYLRCRRSFAEQLWQHSHLVQQAFCAADIAAITAAGQTAALLTVENGSVLCGSLAAVERLAADGVRMLTLTWNNANELAGGQLQEGGFTCFGRQAVAELERCGIVADVSHLCDTAFWELVQLAQRPFVATHSNCRSICNHKRNLTDEQIRAVAAQGGIVGVAYHLPFLTGGGDASFAELCRHIEHIIQLGGEEAVALGSDFDGGSPPTWLSCSEAIPAFTARLEQHFGSTIAARIAGENALEFLLRYEQSA